MISRATKLTVAISMALGLTAAAVAPAGAAPAELKFTSSIMLAQASVAEARIPMFERWMKEAGEDKLFIESFDPNTIVNAKELLPAIERGVIDITVPIPSTAPNMFPICSGYELPFLFRSAKEGAYAFTKLVENNAELQAELASFRLLAFTGSVPMDLVSRTPVRTLEDLRGKRVGVIQAQSMEIAKLLGMVPIMQTLPDFYLSLQRGVLDCVLTPIPTFRSTKVCEVAKFVTRMRVSVNAAPTVMSKASYDKLPADVQAVIAKYTPHAFTVMGANVIEGSAVRDLKWVIENNGVEVIDLSEADNARLVEMVAPAYAAWEELAKGYGVKDPAAILAQLRGYVEEFRAEGAIQNYEAQYIPVLGDLFRDANTF